MACRFIARPVSRWATVMAWFRLSASGPPNSITAGVPGSTATAAMSAATSSVLTHRRGVSPLPKTATFPAAMSNRPSGARWISWKASGRTSVSRIGDAHSNFSVATFARSSGDPRPASAPA
jgi:hypothetical protein